MPLSLRADPLRGEALVVAGRVTSTTLVKPHTTDETAEINRAVLQMSGSSEGQTSNTSRMLSITAGVVRARLFASLLQESHRSQSMSSP